MKYTMQRSNGYVDNLEPSVERPAFGKNDPQRQAGTEPVTTCHNHLNAELNSPRLKRRPWIAFLLLTPFLTSIIGSWAWFNTAFGSGPSTIRRVPRLWTHLFPPPLNWPGSRMKRKAR